MADLEGKTIASTYESILNVGTANNQNLDATPRVIEDGVGTNSALWLATGAVHLGVDDTGADFRVFSATTNEGLFYDASEDEFGLLLTTKLKFHDIGGGEEMYAAGDGALVIASGTSLNINTPTLGLTHSTKVDFNSPILDTVTQGVTVELKQQVDALAFDGAADNILNIDAANNRVGIGTAAPGYKLHVDAGGVSTAARFVSSAAAGCQIELSDGGADYGYFGVDTGGPGKVWLGTVSGAHVNNLTVTDQGRVGIGITTPATLLDIKGPTGSEGAAGSPTLRLTSGVDSGDWDTNDVVSTIETYTIDPSHSARVISYIKTINDDKGSGEQGPDGALAFGTSEYNVSGPNESMRIMGNGNVGIGTANAQYGLLHLAGTGTTGIYNISTSMADANWSRFYAVGQGNSATRYAEFGVHYNSSADVNAPCGCIRMDTVEASSNTRYMWIDDEDDLRGSPTIDDIGKSGAGTPIPDTSSDERLKNISEDPFPYGLSEINNLIPIKFSFKSSKVNKQKLGFGAQTTQPIIPEVVNDTGNCIDGYEWEIDSDGQQTTQKAKSDDPDTKLSMSYNGIIPVLVKAIQELSAKVTALENA